MLKSILTLKTPTQQTHHVQVVKRELKPTSNGGQQLVVSFDDGGGSIQFRFFDKHPWFHLGQQVPVGECLAISGTFSSGQFGAECPDLKSIQLSDEEKVALFRGPKELTDAQDHYWKRILGLMNAYMPEGNAYRKLMDNFIQRNEALYRRAAAARGNHHARRGGLVEHVSLMMESAAVLCGVYQHKIPTLNIPLVLCATFFHDVGKLWENNYPEAGFEQQYDLAAESMGHIVIGAMLVTNLWNQLPEEMRADLTPLRALQHLICSHHGTKEWGSPVEPSCPEAWILHFVDNLDAKLEMMAELAKTGERKQPWLVKKPFTLPHDIILFSEFGKTAQEKPSDPQ